MKKRILTLLLASAVLSTTACGKQEYRISRKVDTSTDTQILKAAGIPSEATEDMSAPSYWDGTLDNRNTRKKNQFDISMKLDYITRKLTVHEDLEYVNNTGSSQREIYLNVVSGAYDDKGGNIDIHEANIGGITADLTKVNDTVYRLVLLNELEAESSVCITLDYTVTIADGAYRLGTVGNTFFLGHAIMTPSQFENGNWLTDPYIEVGDAFYSEISDYRVAIDVPDGYKVAATGTKKNGVYVAENVRDFAAVVSSEMSLLCEEYGDIAILVYYPKKCSKSADHVMETAKQALDLYDSLLGNYPYETLTLVLTSDNSGFGRMEYPGLVTLSTDPKLESGFKYDNPAIDALTRATSNAIAHQWFYAVIGNDQIRHAWIDEGMCRFMEALYCDSFNEGQGDYTLLMELANEDQGVYDAYHGIIEDCFPIRLTDSIYTIAGKHPQEYIEISYKAAAMMYHIYKDLGPEAFVSAMRDYVYYFAYTEVTPAEFTYFWSMRGDFTEVFQVYFS